MTNTKKKKPCIDTFIKAYILTGLNNGRQAAIEAGYSEKTADQQASRLLKTVKVQEAIKEHQKVTMKDFVYDKVAKLKLLQKVMDRCSIDDEEKGMINAPAVISAIKEHNLMQGDNAPIETNNNINVNETLASKLTGGSKR